MIATLIINGQTWWIQAIGLSISLTGLYFWYTGMMMYFDENIKPLLEEHYKKH